MSKNIKDYDRFYKIFTILKRAVNDREVTILHDLDARAIVKGIADLHAAGAAVIEVYDTQWDVQEIGGEPLSRAIEKLARIIDRTGGESR